MSHRVKILCSATKYFNLGPEKDVVCLLLFLLPREFSKL